MGPVLKPSTPQVNRKMVQKPRQNSSLEMLRIPALWYVSKVKHWTQAVSKGHRARFSRLT